VRIDVPAVNPRYETVLLNAFDKIEVTGEVTEIRQVLRNAWVHAPLTFS
jgi:hypothetical protein